MPTPSSPAAWYPPNRGEHAAGVMRRSHYFALGLGVNGHVHEYDKAAERWDLGDGGDRNSSNHIVEACMRVGDDGCEEVKSLPTESPAMLTLGTRMRECSGCGIHGAEGAILTWRSRCLWELGRD